MNEQVKKYYDYLLKQKELHKQWINEALEQDKSVTSLNSKLEYIKGSIDMFKYTFKEYLIDTSIEDEELPGFED